MTDLLGSKQTGQVHARRAVSTLTPELCGAMNDDIQPIPFDPPGARADLESLGWSDSDGDGWLDKDGERFEFFLRTNSGNPRRAKAAILIQAFLADIGVKVEIERIEANTFFSGLRKKQFDGAISGWSAGLYADMEPLWHSGDRNLLNYPSYDNPEVDALIDAANVEPDPVKNAALLRQAQALIYADQPYTFLYWREELIALDKRFKDAKVNVLNPYHELSTWWVPPDEVKYSR
jgi:peptide/nickel transport system substrate-binding protein